MKLPNAAQAIVPATKIVAYLLDAAHPDNGGKAAFFFRHGFIADSPEVLAQALRVRAIDLEVTRTVEGFAGSTRYVIDGPLGTPRGPSPKIRAIWVMERNQTLPRFVTAYPEK